MGTCRPRPLRRLLALPLLTMAIIVGACGADGSESDNSTNGPDRPAEGNGEPIKIGVVLSKTGNFANLGVGWEAAVKLAAEQVNDAGGAAGRPIELIIKDDGGVPDQAISVTRELIDRENVVAVIGPGLTTTAEAGFPVANQLEVPAISPTIVSPTAAPNNRPWTFSIGAPADYLFEANFPALKKQYPDVKRLAVVIEPECAGCVNETTFMADFFSKNGYTVLNKDKPIALQAGAPDVGAQATAIADLKPDAIVGSAGPNEWARLANELDRRGLDIPAFSGTGPNNPTMLQQAGTSAEGWTVLSPFWDENPASEIQTFVQTMEPLLKAAGRPEGAIVGSDAQYFDALKILVQVVDDTDLDGSTTDEDLRQAIRDGIEELTDFEGVTGKMSMQSNGRMRVTGFMLIAKSGKFVRLEA